MKYSFCFLFMMFSSNLIAQVVSFTPNANTQIIQSNTTISIGGGGNKTYLVCPGITLSYAESSTMDTILLESGAVLKIDSLFSYGYSSIYAKAGSLVDINFRQVGHLIFETGANIVDSNIGMPPSFFMGSTEVSSLNYNYTLLPGGIGCTPLSNQQIIASTQEISIQQFGESIQISGNISTQQVILLVNASGQIVKQWVNQSSPVHVRLDDLCSGIYFLRIPTKNQQIKCIPFVK